MLTNRGNSELVEDERFSFLDSSALLTDVRCPAEVADCLAVELDQLTRANVVHLQLRRLVAHSDQPVSQSDVRFQLDV